MNRTRGIIAFGGLFFVGVLAFMILAPISMHSHLAHSAKPRATGPDVVVEDTSSPGCSGTYCSGNNDGSTPPDVSADSPQQMTWGTQYEMTQTSNVGDGSASFSVDKPAVLSPGEYDGTTYGHYIAFQIHYTGETGSVDYNEFDFDLRGPDGVTYNTTFDNDSSYPALNSGSLYAGSKATGWIFFDAPSSALSSGGALEVKGGLTGVIGTYQF